MLLDTNQTTTSKKLPLIVLVIACVIVLIRLVFPTHNILSWDVFGYYLYLPARFIYHDPYLLNQEWLKQIVAQYQSTDTLYQINLIPETSNWIIKYSIGMSYLYAPFFFIAHFLAPYLGYATDGFSPIYAACIEIGIYLYSFFGIYFLYKSLRYYYTSTISSLTLILLIFGTNYIQLITNNSLLTHIPLFTLYSCLIYLSILWSNHKKYSHFYMIALLCGLITIIRPNELIAVLIPLLWLGSGFTTVSSKFTELFKSPEKLVLGSLLFLLPIIPQLLYWKLGSGNWLYYSYQNPGEGLDFLSPHTYKFLFSFRKGWFVYTPIVLISLLGLITLYAKNRAQFWLVLLYTAIAVYVSSSWTCWWYAGGSYSQRAMVSTYPLLALSLASFLAYAFQKEYLKKITLAIVSILVLLNLFQAWQFTYGVIDGERMTYAYYKSIFLKMSRPDNAEDLLMVNRSTGVDGIPQDIEKYTLKNRVTYNYNTAIEGKESLFVDSLGASNKGCLIIDENTEYLDALREPYNSISNKDHFWIKASVEIFISADFIGESPMIVVTAEHKDKGPYKYRIKSIAEVDLKKNAWNHLEFYYLTPEVRSKDDMIKVYFWNIHKSKVLIDDFKVDILEPIN